MLSHYRDMVRKNPVVKLLEVGKYINPCIYAIADVENYPKKTRHEQRISHIRCGKGINPWYLLTQYSC